MVQNLAEEFIIINHDFGCDDEADVNSLTEKYGSNYKSVFFKFILQNNISSTSVKLVSCEC